MALDVLIVDESEAIRKILRRILIQMNIALGKVMEAGDGIEALEILKANKVGLILSDVKMPKMDGLQLLGRVKSDPDFRDIPMVMVTAEGSQAKVMEAVTLGAAGYIRKPFTPEQIKDKLAGLI